MEKCLIEVERTFFGTDKISDISFKMNFYIFNRDRFEDADRFMEFEERGVKIYINQPNSDHVLLQYGRAAVVNDGNWHLVALTCDMIKGVASLYLDTIPHDSVTDPGLVMPDIR
jgi:hypothetical protein